MAGTSNLASSNITTKSPIMSINIFDNGGTLRFQKKFSGETLIQIDISSLPIGDYVVQINSNNNIKETHKIIITH